jgi:glycosyltransferase 2 family protein
LKIKIGRYFRVLLSLSAGIFLLWLIGRGQDVQQILREFREANYFWILMAVLVTLLSHVVRAKRWNLLIASMDYPVSTGRTFYALMAGYLSNLAVPRLGELTRCLVLSRSGKPPLNTLVGTVVIERVFDMFSLLLIIFLTVAFQFGFLKDFLDQLFVGPLLSRWAGRLWVLVLVVVVGLAMGVWGLVALRRKLKTAPENGIFYKLNRQVHGVKNGIKTIARMERKMLFLAYSAGLWALYFLTVYLCFFAISSTAHLGVDTGITLLAVGSLGIVAPVPGGIGTYHFLTITTLTQLYAIAPEPAISYAYISHAIQMVVIIVTGTLAWILVSLEQKKLKGGQAAQAPEQVHGQ